MMKEKKFRISPLYDNSSSLCAYVRESKVEQYLGKDLVLWKSLVDTKSKSLIRITNKDKGQPTHLEVLKFLRKQYFMQTLDTVKKIEAVVTEQAICVIVEKYGEVLSIKRKELIKKFLISKVQIMKEVYKNKEE